MGTRRGAGEQDGTWAIAATHRVPWATAAQSYSGDDWMIVGKGNKKTPPHNSKISENQSKNPSRGGGQSRGAQAMLHRAGAYAKPIHSAAPAGR